MASLNHNPAKMLAISVMWAFCLPLWAGPSCRTVVEANVEVSGDQLTLANLLAPATCGPLQEVAANIKLGAAPLAGSTRVLTKEQIQSWLQRAVERVNGAAWSSVPLLPERVVIRRAGSRASCTEIRARMISERDPAASDGQQASSSTDGGAIQCGAGGRILNGAAFEFLPPVWDARLRQWRVVGRCRQAGDCVPFLLLLPNLSSISEHQTISSTASASASASMRDSAMRTAAVRAGQKVTLIWDQGTFRVVVPAISLSTAIAGDSVQARLPSGQTVPAKVEGAGVLRSTSDVGQDR